MYTRHQSVYGVIELESGSKAKIRHLESTTPIADSTTVLGRGSTSGMPTKDLTEFRPESPEGTPFLLWQLG